MTERQEWRTPPELFAVLDREFRFEADAAATHVNALVKNVYGHPMHYGPDSGLGVFDSLVDDWRMMDRCFCNPGFKCFLPWVQACVRAMRERQCTVVLLGLVAPSTDWWALAESEASEIRLLSPRPQFLPALDSAVKKSSNPRENAVFIFRPRPSGLPKQATIHRWRWTDGTKMQGEQGEIQE